MTEKNKTVDAGKIRVTLLGTGVPTPVMERFGPSTLVEAGGETFLFDVGRGALLRLVQLKTPLNKLRSIFLTHLHSDHIVGLPDVWLTGWLMGRPEIPLHVYGPRGTSSMMEHLDEAFQFDIRIRLYDDRTPPEGVVVLAEDITEGMVYEHNGVKVTAFEVDHYPIQPSFGYRIDYAGRSVVLSGDTRFTENLIKYAQGADVLVHEVIAADMMRAGSLKNTEITERVIAHHTTPEQAGEIFNRVQPRLAVYSHIIPVTATAKDLIPPTQRTYKGPLEVGEDLMSIEIGEKVTVHRTGR
jgi:ribonuclease Z